MSDQELYHCTRCGSTDLEDLGTRGTSITRRFECCKCKKVFSEATAIKVWKRKQIPVEINEYRQGLQQARDERRIENKDLRSDDRMENGVAAYGEALLKVFSENKVEYDTIFHTILNDECVLVVHLTDAHFNELIELPHNTYDFNVASKRVQKLAAKAKRYAKTYNVKRVVLAMTGDMLNSNRRPDEFLTQATNSAQATFIVHEILAKFIIDLNQVANVDVCYVTGNESRFAEKHGFSNVVATDNYDFTIFQTLRLVFKGKPGINFHMGDDPKEYVFQACGQNILMMHGESVGDGGTQKTMQSITGKFVRRDKMIDFIIFGHVHSCHISDFYARGASLAGSNDYNEKGLNLVGKASQNLYLVFPDKTIDKLCIDLQDTSAYSGYDIHDELKAYHAKSATKVYQHPTATLEIVVEAPPLTLRAI